MRARSIGPPARLVHILALTLLAASSFAAAACHRSMPDDSRRTSAPPPLARPAWETVDAVRTGEWFVLLDQPEPALAWRLRSIDAATTSVDVATFIWTPDHVGALVFERLIAAANRGVRVRFLLDDVDTTGRRGQLYGLDAHPHIEVRLFNPYRLRPEHFVLRQLGNAPEIKRVNHRMHDKIHVVDDRLTILGGRNLADEYFGESADMNFRDIDVLAHGASAAQAGSAFDAFWNSPLAVPIRELRRRPSEGEAAASLNALIEGVDASTAAATDADWAHLAEHAHGGQGRVVFDAPFTDDTPLSEQDRVMAREIERLLADAQHDVLIESAYLIPPPSTLAAIASAVERGARVRAVTNSLASNNHVLAHASYDRYIDTLLGDGVELFEANVYAADRAELISESAADTKLGLHAKTIAIDDARVFIGSTNLDPRSLRWNTEIGVVVESTGLNAALRAAQAIDLRPGNAYRLERAASGGLRWIGQDGEVDRAPDTSWLRRLEDQLLEKLPLEDET